MKRLLSGVRDLPLWGIFLAISSLFLVFSTTCCAAAYTSSLLFQDALIRRPRLLCPFQTLQSSSSADDGKGDHRNNNGWKATAMAFDTAVRNRYACKAFHRFDQCSGSTAAAASISDPSIVGKAVECLKIARLTPSAFNTQPYKVVLVHSPAQKLALSKYCLGPNAQRVLDSDCTAVFLADRKVLQTLPHFSRFMASVDAKGRSPPHITKIYIALFSSGYPLPRLLAASFSFLLRTAMSVLNLFTTALLRYPLPSLASAETWSSKQTTMVAMTYMLACSSRGLATIPMEGINAGGIRKVVRAPRRFAVPVIVSTGLPVKDEKNNEEIKSLGNSMDDDDKRRYPLDEIVFGDSFNQQMQISGAASPAT